MLCCGHRLHLPFTPTDAQKSKFAMALYNATADTWRKVR